MTSTHCIDRWSSPLGPLLLLAADDALAGVHFDGQRHQPVVDARWRRVPDHPVLVAAKAQLAAYFAGTRSTFDLPLTGAGTAFQRAVWTAIRGVRHGETISYGELAARAGAPRGIRAAGAATGRNPWSIVVPCHRIVAADGALTGYAGGLGRKRSLLALEAAGAALPRAA